MSFDLKNPPCPICGEPLGSGVTSKTGADGERTLVHSFILPPQVRSKKGISRQTCAEEFILRTTAAIRSQRQLAALRNGIEERRQRLVAVGPSSQEGFMIKQQLAALEARLGANDPESQLHGAATAVTDEKGEEGEETAQEPV